MSMPSQQLRDVLRLLVETNQLETAHQVARDLQRWFSRLPALRAGNVARQELLAQLLSAQVDRGTAWRELVALPAISETRTTVTREELGWRRGEARTNLMIAGEEHIGSHFREWSQRTTQRGRLSTTAILEELADLGFGWRDIAQLVGVSVQAIQKWRRGTATIQPDRKIKLAGLLAACDLVSESYHIEEIASWFEMPMLAGVPIAPLDLWAAERSDLVFDYASGHTDAEETLTIWDPDWRDRYQTDFEVFRAGDDQLSIRLKDR
jgi:transcriptional regulator with XRE-family HTH domain